MTTLERKESKSPKIAQPRPKKAPAKTNLSPEHLKAQLEQKILSDHDTNLIRNKHETRPKSESETQKTENKFQKFGIRVLPSIDLSPKIAECQNDNNINMEKQPMGIDEVDDKKPQARKREKKVETSDNKQTFDRNNINSGSGIKRDANGIPQEIPTFMMNAAVAARSNRKNSDDKGINKAEEEEVDKTPRKSKGKAPAPPEEKKETSSPSKNNNFEDIEPIHEKQNFERVTRVEEEEKEKVELRPKNKIKDYNSDSDAETDNQSSVNTIELNSSDITIHHAEENNEDRQNRKTASTGDLTKINKTRKSSTGTLERAQSLDITDTSIPSLAAKKRKGGRIEDDMHSDEDIFGKVMMSKEPRLSLILDGLNTFQRNRLKKSTEWGNLEDAILKLNQEDNAADLNQNLSLEDVRFGFNETNNEFDALVNKINEIKRESIEIRQEVAADENINRINKKIKNQIWPTFEDELPRLNGSAISPETGELKELEDNENPRLVAAEKRQRKPPVYEESLSVLPINTEKIVKPVIPEKKEHLLHSPKKKSNEVFVPEEEDVAVHRRQRQPNKQEDTTYTAVIPDVVYLNLVDLTRNFIFTEKIACTQDDDDFRYFAKETNISDDIKVSRHSLGSLERAKSDDAKMNVSHVTVTNTQIDDEENLHSLELNVNDTDELYTTALDATLKPNDSKVTINTPDIIQNVTLTEAINTLNNDVGVHGPNSLTLELPRDQENKFSVGVKNNSDLSLESDQNIHKQKNGKESNTNIMKGPPSQTYITEIQVLTPHGNGDVSEIEIMPKVVNSNGRNLDNEFEEYVKNFESNVKSFESNIQEFGNNLETTLKTNENIVDSNVNADIEKERHKIEEIAEEQLKKLPEMRFTTSSYENKPPVMEKSKSQIELLRSNFEKSPSRSKSESTKSRIPIATTAKTPPMSPERRDSRNLDMENDRAILELMSSSVHSTPVVTKSQIKPPSKNVTVTSIRSNSRIPSGLPVLGGSRPPLPPRKQDDDHVVQVSTNGGMESSFKQWVFNPDHAVTNIVVSEGKAQK